ncbi:MAG: L,D-transpeptidase family protein [Sphingomicrobium sp.]
MSANFIRSAAGFAGLATAAVALAQAEQTPAQPSPSQQKASKPSDGSAGNSNWAQPGTPGSKINGQLFHAQVLMSAHGFSPGVIDGKEGESFKLALRSFQEAKGLERTGKLDAQTKQALLQANRPSTVNVRLTQDDVRSQYVFPFPKNPERQAELKFLGYRNMLEKVAERYHTTPDTIIALNGPDARIGEGQTLRLPNIVPQNREYGGVDGKGASAMNILNVDPQQPQGDYVVVDKSEGVLKVYRGQPPAGTDGPADSEATTAAGKDDGSAQSAQAGGQLVAAFPVTMGSKEYPLPIGRWKVTTYAFLPPFKYQPAILNNPKTDKEVDLPPGPNGPVGVAWLDLTKEHYGIHGTSEPQTIGRAESSGCIRMTNWDVLRLSRMLKPGFTAIFQA